MASNFRLLLLLTFLSTLPFLTCDGEPAVCELDGMPYSAQVVHIDAAGLVRVDKGEPVDLSSPDYERELLALLAPVAAEMDWDHIDSFSGTGLLRPTGWLRVRIDPNTTFAQLQQLTSSIIEDPQLLLWKIALQIGSGSAPTHHHLGQLQTGGSICLAEGPLVIYTVDRGESQKTRFAISTRPQYEPVEDDSEPYVPLFASAEPAEVRQSLRDFLGASTTDTPLSRRLTELPTSPDLLASPDVTGAELERAITELLPAEGWIYLDGLAPKNPWRNSRRIKRQHLGRASVIQSADLEDRAYLATLIASPPEAGTARPECAHHLVEGEHLIIAWRDFRPFDMADEADAPEGTNEKLTLRLPIPTYEPGTYDIETDNVQALLSQGSSLTPESARFGMATSGTVTLSPHREGAPMLITCELEFPLFRFLEHGPEGDATKSAPESLGTETRTWTLMATPRDLGKPGPWLGAHDKPRTRETNPRWSE